MKTYVIPSGAASSTEPFPSTNPVSSAVGQIGSDLFSQPSATNSAANDLDHWGMIAFRRFCYAYDECPGLVWNTSLFDFLRPAERNLIESPLPTGDEVPPGLPRYATALFRARRVQSCNNCCFSCCDEDTSVSDTENQASNTKGGPRHA